MDHLDQEELEDLLNQADYIHTTTFDKDEEVKNEIIALEAMLELNLEQRDQF